MGEGQSLLLLLLRGRQRGLPLRPQIKSNQNKPPKQIKSHIAKRFLFQLLRRRFRPEVRLKCRDRHLQGNEQPKDQNASHWRVDGLRILLLRRRQRSFLLSPQIKINQNQTGENQIEPKPSPPSSALPTVRSFPAKPTNQNKSNYSGASGDTGAASNPNPTKFKSHIVKRFSSLPWLSPRQTYVESDRASQLEKLNINNINKQ